MIGDLLNYCNLTMQLKKLPISRKCTSNQALPAIILAQNYLCDPIQDDWGTLTTVRLPIYSHMPITVWRGHNYGIRSTGQPKMGTLQMLLPTQTFPRISEGISSPALATGSTELVTVTRLKWTLNTFLLAHSHLPARRKILICISRKIPHRTSVNPFAD